MAPGETSEIILKNKVTNIKGVATYTTTTETHIKYNKKIKISVEEPVISILFSTRTFSI
jgi:hypothetical protein